MFKVLILQTQPQSVGRADRVSIRDRLSFMRFLGLGLADPVPDANTIWTFREALTEAGSREPAIEVLFARFDRRCAAAGYLAMCGQIVDATDRRRAEAAQHRGREAGDIKEGRIPDGWAEKPAKLRQKDRDARWTVKYTKAKPTRGRRSRRRSISRSRPSATRTMSASTAGIG